MPRHPGTRASQPSTSHGIGQHFTSPRRARTRLKSSTPVIIPGRARKRELLLNRLQTLLSQRGPNPLHHPRTPSPSLAVGTKQDQTVDTFSADFDGADDHANIEVVPDQPPSRPVRRNIQANQYQKWRSTIPTLIEPYLAYLEHTLGKPVPPPAPILSNCQMSCETKKTELVALYYDYFQPICVLSCQCVSLPQLLIRNGLFPTAPSQPRMAVSIELLAFYRALFERSCDAVNALATALNSHYSRRGFRFTDKAGSAVQEPFRRSLGRAIQWYDVLHVELDRHLEYIMSQCHRRITQHATEQSREVCQAPSEPRSARDGISTEAHPSSDRDGDAETSPSILCDDQLVQRCPACFGGTIFARSLADGADIHVATDGNFHHRHRRSAGDSPVFHQPRYFLPKAQVDAVGKRIEQARKQPSSSRRARVPNEAIDNCQSTYEAADGNKQKTSMESFDDTGVMSLICRHDIPLFFANIDTPGEQQKYSIALIEHLFSLLPPQATVVVLYDIGCVVDRSNTLAQAVGTEMLRDLGGWQKRRLKKGIREQGDAAQKVIDTCAVSLSDLRSQWAEQRTAQLSVRAHAPARLKKELDTVLVLQAELDASDRAIQTTRAAITRDEQTVLALEALDSMERTHNCMLEKVQTLYSSLNVEDHFPELHGVSLDFVRILLMARDLKINIRKRAIGSFFEWDKLDRAVGGKDKALGTKLHQHTRKSIAKRQPALMSAIRKYNQYCEQLEQLYDPLYAIPLPSPLPTKLADLRSDQSLLQDVWITPAEGNIPRWLEDQTVRDGIRALLKRDRCHEEQVRLGMEADNMCRWFGKELAAVELASRLPEYRRYHLLFWQRREELHVLEEQWPSPLASAARYASRAQAAIQLAAQVAIITTASNVEIQWLPPVVCSLQSAADDEEEMDPAENETPDVDEGITPEQVLLGDVLTGRDNEDEEAIATVLDVNLLWNEMHQLTRDVFDLIIPITSITPPLTDRAHPPTSGFGGLFFEKKDLEIFTSREARLNDTCVNGCAALLYSVHVAHEPSPFAVLSTHDLIRIRYNAADEDLWRNTARTKYWDKAIWILPIHRPSSWGHWIVCSIHFNTRRILLFDSLAEEQPWRNDLTDIMTLVNRLCSIAHTQRGAPLRHSGEWSAIPVMTVPLQANDVDCGLWVLAQILAVFRGHERTGFKEQDMVFFRQYLLALVQTLPVASL
ncbi:hypothetical protein JVT61DRAFT_13361 [Boletus reticuloceps]|uniref:Ubiquitin-like protease family profile domain-containing protein n=1 Tax=Boletus reticuloceps TaxID=495285 RepID=A0A8I2YDJ2_9AGAM|nr:hypothetical protein JVT61DRAFT_13361 [Boletus reticuloceps]